tara:strand:+ start:470 stop:724 length:255 start_codon:yes stop_codon:yes gene_type:complete
MKQYLTEKNLMWAAIALLAAMVLSSCSSECCGDTASARKGMKQRMEMAKKGMRGRMQGQRRGSRGDSGKGVWVTREALTETESE